MITNVGTSAPPSTKNTKRIIEVARIKWLIKNIFFNSYDLNDKGAIAAPNKPIKLNNLTFSSLLNLILKLHFEFFDFD